MSFYGNISNAAKTQMSFDRVYPNRKIMEENASTDGVFIGRFVLVEYDDNTYSHRTGYINYTPNYDDEQNGSYLVYTNLECSIPFKLSDSDENGYGLTQGDLIIVENGSYYYYFQFNGKTDPLNKNAYFNYITSSTESFDDTFSDYVINYNEDKKYAKEKNYPFTIGWDSTVWRKVYKNNKEQYQVIASLNSITPKFTLTAEAPTIIPTAPHFGINSTNINYDLHYQPNWGLRVKRAGEKEKSDVIINVPYKADDNGSLIEENSYRGAIYFNKDGFNPKVRALDEKTNDEITILPSGNSGQEYIVHDENGNFSKGIKNDTQEITLNLPSIGNIMSDVWDVVYGPVYDKNGEVIKNIRDTNLSWDDNFSEGNRLITKDRDGDGYRYNTERIATVAGCINSVHDLMGKIIENAPPPDNNIESANSNKIYYGQYDDTLENNKGFYFKDKTYKLESFVDAGIDPNEYVGKRKYYDLTQFVPNTYYIYSNRSFYIDKSTVPAPDTKYYKLGDPIQVKLKQWQPEITVTDPVTGEETTTIQYSYYRNENLDYIKDKSEDPDENKTYYQITLTSATNPQPKQNEETIKFFWLAGLASAGKVLGPAVELLANYDEVIKTLGEDGLVKQGYFYRKSLESGTDILVPFTADTTADDIAAETEFFYFDKYALSEPQQDDTGNQNGIAYIISESLEGGITANKLDISFTAALNNEENYNTYLKPHKITLIPFEDNKYYCEIEDDEIEGYKCLHAVDDLIFDEKICYTIEATYDAGVNNIITPPEDEETDNSEEIEEIFFYKRNLYFTKDRQNYILSKSLAMSPDTEYYLLTNKYNELLQPDPNSKGDGTLILPKAENENEENSDINKFYFYEPGKYYYESSEFLTDILDNDIIMKTAEHPNGAVVDPDGRIYYTIQEAYVVEDTAGILKAGSVWDKEVAPPDTVTLGVRTEAYKWTELKGFAKQLNTIHGLILEINKFLKFNDTLTRDRTTVQGCINQINDIINIFGEINPSDTVIINSYGQFAGARYITDNWINISTNKSLSDPSITVNHIGPTENTTQIGETVAQALKFGGSFKSHSFGIDEKGHVNNTKTASVDITLPSLAIANGTTGNVLTSLGISTDGQLIVANNSDIGTLQLASYQIKDGNEIVANDSINDAFGKLQGQIKALDFTDPDANTTQFISKITQSDGKISVERHNAGDLVLTGYTIATAKTAISTTDTINSAFGKLEYRLDILQAGDTQEGSVAYQIAQIVNENNNGSIDTLNEIAAWIVNDETGVAKMNADISNLKTDVSKLKEQVQTASTGLLDRTSSLENLVGTKTVSAQINEALFVDDKAIYALASDLEDLASNADAWNVAEQNVQSDWSESDTTSDAYILNKPDLSNMIETTSQFDYTIGDVTNQLTIAQLVAKVAELEATIQVLTAST